MFGESTNVETQPYKYNGKEFDGMYGLNLFDYGARHYDAAIGRWMNMDPLSEGYNNISPYAYCGNNPVNFIDPDGRREWPVNPTYNGYGRRHENNFGAARPNGRTHKGVDINHTGGGNTDKGAPIIATHDGAITRVVTIGGGDKDGGGNRVQITSSDGSVSSYYMHLDAVSDGIQTGTVVTEGQQIGTMGGSGKGKSDAYTSHLHYEIKIDGVKVDPATSSTNLIDPQQLITPLNGGTLPEVVVTGPKPVTVVPVPEIKPLPTQLPDKLKIQ
ncbi:MAG: peptidoglycan DD-metalloendopeptidase family protein [Dysgonamonadaceae bacterium]|nr:peptidoglycan DD-metalloendopeptidase family protein [Dysgonamonadaceae bacterium]MDD3901662.1 peptidoglycan DD-metalloendopeptidase family protein [Dysgonamonadaceae bacterium]MDD4399848.1 peptidoglycan DD-metalloendopeptidase family protein [Dysgonamonadaceae bacterium]